VAAKQPGATLAITDGNQRRAIAFGTIQDDVSYLLGAGQRPEGLNPSTPLVYGSLGPTDAQTVAAPIGVASVSATSYGSSPLHPEPLQGPAAAFDDNRSTAWVATGVDNSIYQSLSVTFDKPEYVTRIAITPLNDSPDRPSIENVDIKTDQGLVHRFVPRTNAPVWLTVAPGETRHLKIVIRMVRRPRKRQDPPLGAGITQVTIPGVTFQPAMRLPTVELATFSQPGRKPPVVSVSDPVANPNLDFTGPTSSTPPITRIVDLPSRLNATSTGTVVPNPGADLTAVVNEAEAPMDLQVHAVASSSLRDLPKFGAENLVVRSATPWIAGMNDGRPSVTLRWSGVRSVSSLVFGLTSLASRPTRLLITSTVGSRTVAVPRTGGTISFAPLVTDSLTIHVVSVAVKRGIVPTGSRTAGFPRPKPVVLPVGLASVTVPAVGGQQPVPPVDPATSVAIPCGDGPTVDIDGASHPTEVSGTLGNLVDLQPMAFHLCPSSTELAAGRHTLSFPSSSAFRVTGLLLQPSGSAARSGHATPVRTLHVTSWAPASRSVVVGAGPTTFLQVAQNINRGWTATLYGRTLTPVTLDGWQQGWVIPAGASGTIIMTFGPDRTFRAALALGALFLLVLLVLALVGGEGTASEPVGRRRRIPQWLVVVGAAVVVSGVGGALALVLLPLVLVGRRWGTRWLAAMSGAAFALAGLIVAVDPNTVVDYSSGAFGAPAQILSVVALCAVLAVVVVEEAR
jgi:arabinofuranan 3-O-arabinosyltransferase